ncbi:uncharacterized protein LOC129572502 [Sitodiplosis mosellana]|uniref:uncharacterized protein LOC129572502 n=1 Tax=Sitodiplosis mosellana TaxID=263140 RepID=UPI002443FA8D|nr:uncharacterized protein LOC129572502 [Sitodiplosis mosellana]
MFKLIIAVLCFVAVVVARPGLLLSEEYHGNSAFALRHGLPVAAPLVAAPVIAAPWVAAPLVHAPVVAAPLVHTPLVDAYAHSYGYDDLLGYSAL